MDYENELLTRNDVANIISKSLAEITLEIPCLSVEDKQTALIAQNGQQIMTFDRFYDISYKCFCAYLPRKDENPLIKLIRNLPRAIQNIKRINENQVIIELQNKILHEYFYDDGEKNIRKKIGELEHTLKIYAEDEDFIYLVYEQMDRFKMYIRDNFVSDMKNLEQLLHNR